MNKAPRYMREYASSIKKSAEKYFRERERVCVRLLDSSGFQLSLDKSVSLP